MYGELNEDDFSASLKPALEALEALKATNSDDPDEPVKLSLRAVELVPHVFQVRGTDISEHHVGELLSALKAGHDLDPIIVWRCGKHALLVDGHHRLDAYQQHQMVKQVRVDIPVTWFQGSAEEAMKAAAKANVPAKLQMTPEQRANLAWRLTLLGRLTKKDIAATSGVAQRTVANMRKAIETLGEAAASCKSWTAAMMRVKDLGGELSDEDAAEMRDLQVKKWADRLAKAYGNKLTTNTSMAAEVMAVHFGRALPDFLKALMMEADISPEELEAMVDEVLNPEF
jgi:hypothetical protein